MPAGPCPDCKSENTGRSPTGDWCNACGWSYPGYWCPVCKRESVQPNHKNEGEPCLGLEGK